MGESVIPQPGWYAVVSDPNSWVTHITHGKAYRIIEIHHGFTGKSGIGITFLNNQDTMWTIDSSWFSAFYPDTELAKLIYG